MKYSATAAADRCAVVSDSGRGGSIATGRRRPPHHPTSHPVKTTPTALVPFLPRRTVHPRRPLACRNPTPNTTTGVGQRVRTAQYDRVNIELGFS